MGKENNNWQNLWKIFEEIILQPHAEHNTMLASIENSQLRQEVEKLLQAHYSGSFVLDSKPPWQENIDQTFQPPNVINGYKIKQKLGSGGIGDVYLGEKNDDGFERQVAIKFATTGRFAKHVLASFNTELEVLLSLNHPNIERLYDGGITDQNIPYLIVEYINGCTIEKYCDENRISLSERLKLFQKICFAVDAVHRSLVIHRDIKAGNIMIGKDGEPKLLDFGIAKLVDEEQNKENKKTTLSSLMMTLAYASPEQINSTTITTTSDIYSLGVLLYYLLTGNLPYDVHRKNLTTTIKTINEYTPKLASKNIRTDSVINKSEKGLVKKLAGELEQIIAKALAKDPLRRYMSATAFAKDIQNTFEKKPISAKQDSFYYRLSKFLQRHVLGFTMSSIAIISLILLSGNLYIQSDKLKKSLKEKNQEQQKVVQVTEFLKDMFEVSDPLLTDKKIIKVKDLLDYSSQKLGQQFNNEKQTKATLYETLGNVYLNMSYLPEAEKMFNQADELFIDGSIDKAKMYLSRTKLYQQHGKFELAKNEIEEMLIKYRFNELPIQTQTQVEVLRGQINSKMGHYQLAEKDLVSAMKKRIELYGKEHKSVVDIYQLLGNINWRLGDFQLVKNYYQLGYDINYKNLGRNNHRTLKSLTSLGVLAYSQGDYSLALKKFKYVANERLSKLGNKHVLTADSYNRLGAIYVELVEYDNAVEALTLAKEIYESLNLEDSSKYSRTLNNLALVLRQKKKYLQAQKLFLNVKSINLKTLGEKHPDTASTDNNLGMVAADLGNIQQAMELFKNSYEVQFKNNGLKNANIAFSMTNIGRMHLYLDNVSEAKNWIDKALKIRLEKLGKDNIYYIETLSASAEIAMKQKHFEEANTLLQEVLIMRKQKFPVDDWRIAEALNMLAALNYTQDKVNYTKQFYCSLTLLKQKLGEEHYRVQASEQRQKEFNLSFQVQDIRCNIIPPG